MKWLIDLAILLMKTCWPKRNSTDEEMHNWRIIATIMGLGNLALVIATLALALGATPFYPGVAQAGDAAAAVAPVQAQISQQQVQMQQSINSLLAWQKQSTVRSMESDLIAIRKAQCVASSPSAREFASSRLFAGMQTYRSLAGYEWPVPDCKLVM